MFAMCRRYTRWYTCILLFCFVHHNICTIDASDAQTNQRENAFAEYDLKPRKLIMRGQNSQPAHRAMNKDKMTAKQIAKMKRVDRKRMQMMARRKKKESKERNKMRTNRGRIKPQYDLQPNMNPTPKGQPSNTVQGQYGPPPVNADGPPPPMRPPPPMWEGTGYRPPPPLDRPPPPPPRDDMMEPSTASGSKASKVDDKGGGNKPPIKPGKPPYPPHFPPDRPIWSPTYMPTKEPEVEGEGIQITVQGLLNTYGLGFPLSSEGYDAMVNVFDLTIHESSSTSLADNQIVIQVKILEIEGITSQFLGGSRRELQNFDTNSFQCTIVEQKQCCEREPPSGSENPAQFCESMGCNINDCRRIRFDIIAEQFSRRKSNNLQPQSEVDELSTAITESTTRQINSGAFTFHLRENGGQCGDSCSQAFSIVAATSAVFAPPTDIIIRTATPTPRPTRKPTKEHIITYPTLYPTLSPTINPTLAPTLYPTLRPTLSPTLYPTQSPTLSPTILLPTPSPTLVPTLSPTISPTNYPTVSPTISPTHYPTISPTNYPTISPTE